MKESTPQVKPLVYRVMVLHENKSTWLEHSQEPTWLAAAQVAKQLQKDCGRKTKVLGS